MRENLVYATVPDSKTPKGDIIPTGVRAGTGADGSPLFQHLMATPKSFKAERDAAAEEERLVKEGITVEEPTDEKGTLSEDEYYMHENTSIGRK